MERHRDTEAAENHGVVGGSKAQWIVIPEGVERQCWTLHPDTVLMLGPFSSSHSQAPENFQVLLGNTQLYQQTQHTQKISVNRIISHPDFEKFHPFGSDIAMLQLCLPVNFTSYVIPACLPPRDTGLPRHTSYWITGWGKLAEDSKKKRSGTGKGGRKRREPEA